MKGSELLSCIRRDLEGLSEYTSRIEEESRIHSRDPPTILSQLATYNLLTLVEIREHDRIRPDFEIDVGTLVLFRDTIDRYLEVYAPGNPNLKRYVTNISMYLTFIAKRPLHPPSLENIQIVKTGDAYSCSGKRRFMKDTPSLCRYCICRAVGSTEENPD